MPNTKNIDLLIKVLREEMETRKIHFNMETWGHKTNCGTAACIGGTICIILGGPSVNSTIAAEWLDIDYHMSQQLFYPHAYSRDKSDNWHNISTEDAIIALELVKRGRSAKTIRKYWKKLRDYHDSLEIK